MTYQTHVVYFVPSSGISAIRVTVAGSAYEEVPGVTISAPPSGGTQATATATLSGSGVASIAITNAGSGYVTAPTVTIAAPTGTTSPVTAMAVATIEADARSSRHVWVSSDIDKDNATTYANNADNVEEAVELYGAGSLAVSSALVDVPIWAQPNIAYYNTTTSALVRDLYAIRTGLRAGHVGLMELSSLLMQVGANYPQVDVALAHDILFALHCGSYWVINESTLTPQQKAEWLQLSALGPTDPEYDINDPETFFAIAAAIDNRDHVVASTGALSIVDVDSASPNFRQRRSIRVMINDDISGGNRPSVADLDRGRWIDSVPY